LFQATVSFTSQKLLRHPHKFSQLLKLSLPVYEVLLGRWWRTWSPQKYIIERESERRPVHHDGVVRRLALQCDRYMLCPRWRKPRSIEIGSCYLKIGRSKKVPPDVNLHTRLVSIDGDNDHYLDVPARIRQPPSRAGDKVLECLIGVTDLDNQRRPLVASSRRVAREVESICRDICQMSDLEQWSIHLP